MFSTKLDVETLHLVLIYGPLMPVSYTRYLVYHAL